MPLEISFKALDEGDFPLLLHWLRKPHVQEWWDDGDDTLEKVSAHYSVQCGENTDQRGYLVHLDGSPIGYIQYYTEPKKCMGIDFFIGEKDFLDRGVGTMVMRSFVTRLREEHSPSRIIIDPEPANLRAIRCYEKVGFRHYDTVTVEHGKLAYMMEIKI